MIEDLDDTELDYYIFQGTPAERAAALAAKRKRLIASNIRMGMSPADADIAANAAIESAYGTEALAEAIPKSRWEHYNTDSLDFVREAERLKSKYENALSPEERAEAKQEINMFMLRHIGPKNAAALRRSAAQRASFLQRELTTTNPAIRFIAKIGKKSVGPESSVAKFIQSPRFQQAAQRTIEESRQPYNIGMESAANAAYIYSLPFEGAFKLGQYLSKQGFSRREYTSKGSLLSNLAGYPPIKLAEKTAKKTK